MEKPIDKTLMYQLVDQLEFLWLENHGLKGLCIEWRVPWEDALAAYVSDPERQVVARHKFAGLREQIDASEDYETLLRTWLSTLPPGGKPS